MAIDEFAVYNKFEIRLKKKYSRIKATLFRPLVLLLDRLGLNANGVSFLGFAAAFLFWLCAAVFKNGTWALVCMVVSVLLDNLDGSLAEYQGPQEIGPVVDNFYDLAALACVVGGMAALGQLRPALGVVYWLFYVGIIAGSFILSFNGIKAFVARLRFVVYSGYVIIFFLGPVLALDLWVFLAILVEAVSLGSIALLYVPRRRVLRRPAILGRLTPLDKILGLASLIAVLAVGLTGLWHALANRG